MSGNKPFRELLFPIVLILFILQVLLLPVVIGLTYATRSEKPEHILTYTARSLTWDRDTSVRSDGSAELSFFETLYQNVQAENAEKILAPGTEKDSILRLKNDVRRSIGYTAVLYMLKSTPELAVTAALSGDGFSDLSSPALPQSISPDTVLRAVSGTVGAGKMQDFDINWFWQFEGDTAAARDRIDTYLGNRAAAGTADDVTLGFYLVVHDKGDRHPSPNTGDRSLFGGYLVLMAISGTLCLILLLEKRRRQ